jgi:hypothetical protein
MVAGFAAGFDSANLFFLEIVDEFRDDSFVYTELFLTRMRDSRIDARQPGRVGQ